MELAIAIAIDPFRALATEPTRNPDAPSPPPRPPPPVAFERPTESATVVNPARSPPKPVIGEVVLAATAGVGAAPVRNWGGALGVRGRRGDLSVGVEGRADLPASMPARVGDVSTSLLVASLVPCVHLRLVSACGLVAGGALRAAGHGLVDARQVTDPYFALGARVAVELHVTFRLSLMAYGDVSAPLTETELKVGGEELWTTPPISFLFGLGLAFNVFVTDSGP